MSIRTAKLGRILWTFAGLLAVEVQQPLWAAGTCINLEGYACHGIADDLYVNGSGAIFITGDDPAIYFNDTTPLPTGRDWRLKANDGFDTYFSIDDITGFTGVEATSPIFRIDGNAPTNSIRVAYSGNIGFGTATPGLPLHIVSPTPAIRFEDTATGYGWDVHGNAGNFVVRDTATLNFPLVILPGSPTDSIRIAANGDIGIGTPGPTASVDIVRSSGNAAINMTASTSWQIRSNGANDQLNFVNNTDSKTPFRTGRAANTNLFQVGVVAGDRVDITGKLFINNAGPVNAPDYVFQPGYEIEPIEEHAAYMWENSHLPAVGAGSAEVDVMQATWGILEELEKAHIYIERLHEENKQQKADLAEKDRRLAAAEERLARIEALLAARPGANQ